MTTDPLRCRPDPRHADLGAAFFDPVRPAEVIIEGLRALPPAPGLAAAREIAPARPETMVIAQAEAIWSAIDRDDDWAPLAVKRASVRATGAFHARRGLLTGALARPGHAPIEPRAIEPRPIEPRPVEPRLVEPLSVQPAP